VEFDDEAFSLRGKQQVMGMWTMLSEATKAKGKDVWRLEHSGIQPAATAARPIGERALPLQRHRPHGAQHHRCRVQLNDQGLVVKHRDSFNFWHWSSQALGTPGLLLGWSPMLRNKVRTTAAGNLTKFMQNQSKRLTWTLTSSACGWGPRCLVCEDQTAVAAQACQPMYTNPPPSMRLGWMATRMSPA